MNTFNLDLLHIIILIGILIVGGLVIIITMKTSRRMVDLTSKIEQLDFRLSNINSTVDLIYDTIAKEEEEDSRRNNYDDTEFDPDQEF
jgi:hypothetical protein